VIGWAFLSSILRRRPKPLTETEIAALAADPDRFEEYAAAWCDPRIDYSKGNKV
jgi:hypothetical protein